MERAGANYTFEGDKSVIGKVLYNLTEDCVWYACKTTKHIGTTNTDTYNLFLLVRKYVITYTT